jgi:hypothetical protein
MIALLDTLTRNGFQMDYVLGFLSGAILTLASCAAWFSLLEWL